MVLVLEGCRNKFEVCFLTELFEFGTVQFNMVPFLAVWGNVMKEYNFALEASRM